MNFIGRQWARLKRFGHRNGYGVHSPFAFNFLTSVVYERGMYYAYQELAQRNPVPLFRGGRHETKCRRFLFRLANYVHPSVIRLVGHVGKAEADYMAEGCRSARMQPMTPEQGRKVYAEPAGRQSELVWLGTDVPFSEWEAVVSRPVSEHSVCIIPGIYRSSEAKRAWERVKGLRSVVVTFDLYDYGLVFYDRSKQRQHYVIKF